MQNIFAFCTICTKIYIKMICFLAVYLKIIIFAPTNMEQGRMILLRIAGRTTQGKAYFGKALSNLLSVKESVYMLYRITNTVNISTNAWIFLC